MMPFWHTINSAGSADLTSSSDSWLDRVTEDSADSFPASDPPSWTPLRIGSPAHDPRRGPHDD